MNYAERAAQRVVEAVIAGSRMEYVKDQSVRVHDFDLFYRDGTRGAVEVSSVVDGQRLATEAAIRKGGRLIPRKACSRDWLVFPSTGARIADVRGEVDGLLAAVEADGLERFHCFWDADEYESVRRLCHRIGVSSGCVVPWREPGIMIGGTGGGGAVGVGHAISAVETLLQSADNLEKLDAADTDDTHFFAYIDSSSTMAWIAIRDIEPPSTPPILPAAIRTVWVAGAIAAKEGWMVWRGNARGWERIGHVPSNPSSSGLART